MLPVLYNYILVESNINVQFVHKIYANLFLFGFYTRVQDGD